MAHDHNHSSSDYNRAFAIGVLLNSVFVGVETGYGIYADSLALIADAWHNLSDVLSLLLAWGASWLAARAATERRTYGYRKATIVASLLSAVLLLVALGAIAWEAIGRLLEPRPVAGMVVVIVAAIGVVINTLTALLFVSGQKHDLNIKAAFLHMAADAGISLGVVIAGLIIIFGGWNWIDPVISLAIVIVILIGTWSLLRHSINLVLDAVPEAIDMDGIKSYLNSLDRVSQFHDLHIWSMSTTEVALTVHLVVTENAINDDLLHEIQHYLHDRFGIAHSTIQLEREEAGNYCLLDRHQCI